MWKAIGNIPKSSERKVTKEHIEKLRQIALAEFGKEEIFFPSGEEIKTTDEGGYTQYRFIHNLEIDTYMVYEVFGESDYMAFQLQTYVELYGNNPDVVFRAYKPKR